MPEHLGFSEPGLKTTDVTVRQTQTKCIKYHQHQWILLIAKNILAYQRRYENIQIKALESSGCKRKKQVDKRSESKVSFSKGKRVTSNLKYLLYSNLNVLVLLTRLATFSQIVNSRSQIYILYWHKILYNLFQPWRVTSFLDELGARLYLGWLIKGHS